LRCVVRDSRERLKTAIADDLQAPMEYIEVILASALGRQGAKLAPSSAAI